MATITGTANDEPLNGTSAADRIFGLGGADWIYGNGGADQLYGGDGDDWLQGGGGNDLLDGGAGVDTADYSDTSSAVRIDLAAGTVTFPNESWAAETLIAFENAVGSAFDDVLIGSAGANALFGGAGNDWTEGGAGADSLYGGAGDDVLWGQGGNDALYGGAGSDTAIYSDVAGRVRIDLAGGRATFLGTTWKAETLVSIDNAIAGAGNDELIGGSGANRLDGGAGDDVARGGGGNDILVYSGGDDAFFGGSGSDTLRAAFGFDAYGEFTFDPDRIDYASAYDWHDPFTIDAPRITVDLVRGSYTFAADETWQGTLSGVERVDLTDAHSTVIGNSAANVVTLGRGANHVLGGGGDDTIFGGSSSFAAVTGQEEFPEQPPEELFGGSGDDTIHGNGNSFVWEDGDWFVLKLYEDRLYGGAGDDDLRTGFGRSSLYGGDGADDFVFTDAIRDRYPLARDGYFVMAEGTVHDYDRTQGDRIILDLGDVQHSEVDRSEPDEPTYARMGDDAVVSFHFGTFVYYDDTYSIDLEIVLKDFAGALSEIEIAYA